MRSIIAAAAGILLATSTPALAQHAASSAGQQPAEGWPRPGHVEHGRNAHELWREPVAPARHIHRRPAPRVEPVRQAPRVAAWVRREAVPELPPTSVCRPTIDAVGDQATSEDSAKKEAEKSWAQSVRWAYGEKYMTPDNARGVVYHCGRSSVGSVLNNIFFRCELRAAPCMPLPSMERGAK